MDFPPTPASIHSSKSTNGAEYNIFGYDPEGRLLRLAAHFYGPAWQPVTYTHLPSFHNFDMALPRFGPPAPQQMPWVPPGFIPRSPPLYYGQPFPPYLPAPKTFDPEIFAALLLRHRRQPHVGTHRSPRVLEQLPVGEVADGRRSSNKLTVIFTFTPFFQYGGCHSAA
jgi:hypothetical protein